MAEAIPARRVLFLTSSTGSGHDSRAYALRELCRHDPAYAWEIRVEHILERSSLLLRFGVGLYNWIQRHAPALHRLYWHVVERVIGVQSNRLFWGRRYYRRLLRTFRPELIVSFHDSTNRGYFAEARKLLGAGVGTATYCGEFGPGRGFSANWIEPTVDRFFARTVACADVAQGLGVAAARTQVFFPVFRPPFFAVNWDEAERRAWRRQWGLAEDRLTLLLATGGQGANSHVHHLEALAAADLPVQVIVVCGRNQGAYRRVQRWRERHQAPPVYFEGHSRQMHRLFAAADVCLLRGGSNATAEALWSGCVPLFRARGGFMPQEELTVAWCEQQQVGVRLASTAALCDQLAAWIADPDDLRARRERVRGLPRGDAPATLLASLAELLPRDAPVARGDV